jgi:hypothetical protein
VAPGSGNPEPLEPTPPAVARIALTAAKRDEIHAALGKVLAHHSPDATVVVALSVLEVRASAELSPVLLRAGESTTFTQLRMLMVGSCDLALGARGEWLSMAMVERPGALLKEYELIARGDWSRAEMEACFGQGRPGPVSRATAPGLPGEPITVVPTDGPPVLIGWLDEHTFYSTTSTADAAAIAARLTPRTGKPSALDQIGSRIDRQASAWLVGTRAALAAAVETPALTADVSVRLELDDAGLVGTVALYQPTASARRHPGRGRCDDRQGQGGPDPPGWRSRRWRSSATAPRCGCAGGCRSTAGEGRRADGAGVAVTAPVVRYPRR